MKELGRLSLTQSIRPFIEWRTVYEWFNPLRAFLYQVYTIIALTDRDIDRDGEGIFG